MGNKADKNKELAKLLKESGMPNTAKYILMFGDHLPSMWGWSVEKKEEFFGMCIKEKRPWDYFLEPADDNAIL